MPATAPPPEHEPRAAAESAGLVYVSDQRPGLTRQPQGDGFAYLRANGEPVTDAATLERIRKLAIPPAWTEVWICPRADGHLQATGRDARGRKQYRYHAAFREQRESSKYEHMLEFARALPALRAHIARDMALRGLPREKVLATVVHLLECTLIRVGNEDYARANRSYGLTTLKTRHAQVEGSELRFRFQGKSGRVWRLALKDRRVARIVRACQELPGQELFQYLDEEGEVRTISSGDVNAYLKEASGSEITAKDFRTWAGTVLAALALQEAGYADTQAGQRKLLREAIASVAARLGNTPTICRKCYIHPQVLQAHAEGQLVLQTATPGCGTGSGLRPQEQAVLRLLEARLDRDLAGQLNASLQALDGRRRAA